ncbi:MAG: hypothetical protein GX361_00365 [Bacteroidales bacterium]|nr:hypothetical protein [Bacteroidales bacterium]
MTNEQIQHRKNTIAKVCVILLICITVFGTVSAFVENRNNELRNNVSSISNFEQQDADLHGNTHIFNNQKNK